MRAIQEQNVQIVAIAFHDIVETRDLAHPIGPGHGTLYTLSGAEFRNHLAAIRSRVGSPGVRRVDQHQENRAVMLTFDDGAASAYTHAAPELERLGWPGHFFVTTDWIGRPGFVDQRQIRYLHEHGHVIGSHSCSHPLRISHLSWTELVDEWARSCGVLADIIGQPVRVASVPGGFYSREVAQAAAAAGIQVLFTSEPTAAVSYVDTCLILGRYSIRHNASANTSGALAAGGKGPWRKQSAAWLAKKAAKQIMGKSYFSLRRMLLA
jgi:peptidoglycan/xylan/chitin deacetylase (PgdA/CDA1 family)